MCYIILLRFTWFTHLKRSYFTSLKYYCYRLSNFKIPETEIGCFKWVHFVNTLFSLWCMDECSTFEYPLLCTIRSDSFTSNESNRWFCRVCKRFLMVSRSDLTFSIFPVLWKKFCDTTLLSAFLILCYSLYPICNILNPLKTFQPGFDRCKTNLKGHLNERTFRP